MSKSHHIRGPSSLDALSKCCRFKYGEFDAEAASEGTELHAAFEVESVKGLTQDQAKDVQACIDYVNSLKASEGGPDCWQDSKEVPVELEGLTFGTADRRLIHKSKPIVHVIDAKFTRVESDHVRQLMAYGAGTVEMLRNKGITIPFRVTLHTIEPRLGDIKTEEWDGDTLLKAAREDIEAIYAREENPWNPETPHEDVCCKCARASYCPSLNATAVQVAQRIGLPMPSVLEPGAVVSSLDMARLQVLAGALENWAKATKQANAQYAADTGEVPEGFKLVTRSTGIRVPKENTPQALQQLEEAGLDRVLILESCSLTLGDLVEKMHQYMGMAKPDAKELVREALGDLAQEGACSFLQKSKRITDEALLLQLNEGG